MGIPTFTRRFFEELYGRLKIPYLVVFDNYHEVQGESMFHEVIRDGLGEVSEGINVIIISRSEPPQVLERMRANQLIGVIPWDDIRLDLDEFKGIVRHKGQKKMQNDMIMQLHSKTEGWAAGLLLMLEKSKTEGIAAHSLNTHDPEVIFDYFAGEIFQKIDKETQDVLARTALLPSITPAMVNSYSS
jgi:ATP/maltotriose-dependent transcriptional regulator MalT